MSKNEFIELQHRQHESGKTLKEFLIEIGVGYSTYNYWRRKYLATDAPHELAPISFRASANASVESPLFCKEVPSGATLLFPNGLRAHFGSGTESMLMSLLKESLSGHVLS